MCKFNPVPALFFPLFNPECSNLNKAWSFGSVLVVWDLFWHSKWNPLQGILSLCSALIGHTWNTGSSLELPSTRETKSKEKPQR